MMMMMNRHLRNFRIVVAKTANLCI